MIDSRNVDVVLNFYNDFEECLCTFAEASFESAGVPNFLNKVWGGKKFVGVRHTPYSNTLGRYSFVYHIFKNNRLQVLLDVKIEFCLFYEFS